MNAGQASGWFGWALASAAFAALTAIFAKVGVQRIDSDMATWIRTAVVMGALSVFIAATGKWSDPTAIPARTWTFLVLSGLAAGASWLCYYRALQDGPASLVVPIDKLSIVVTVAFATFVLRERLTRRAGAGLALVVAGTMVMLI